MRASKQRVLQKLINMKTYFVDKSQKNIFITDLYFSIAIIVQSIINTFIALLKKHRP